MATRMCRNCETTLFPREPGIAGFCADCWRLVLIGVFGAIGFGAVGFGLGGLLGGWLVGR